MKTIKQYLIYIGLVLMPFSASSQLESGTEKQKHEINSRGEFSYRMDMVINRLMGNTTAPVFTEKFILGDVNIDLKDPRRFYNFSGDLSGRFIEVLSLMSKDNPKVNAKHLVDQLLRYQQKDGRFGNDTLVYTKAQIGAEHMAQIWGNGRLLVGLMEYYNQQKDPAVLKSASKLGDFLVSTFAASSDPAVIKRLEGLGANGIICLTQNIEGFVMLTKATNNPKYAATATKIYPVLPKRGVQHSHGYLTTLRGILDLYQYDHDVAHLNYVKKAYDELVLSKDFNVMGTVNEYFGGVGERDEGCSTADFIRLSLQLYQISGDVAYLEKGEFAVLNGLYFNQYYTGDFGHHFVNDLCSRPDYPHTAWWCCTMHGLRTMYDVRNTFLLEKSKGARKLNLYLETDVRDADCHISIRKSDFIEGIHHYKVSINKWLGIDTLMFRIPNWSELTTLNINGKPIPIKPGSKYAILKKQVKQGDVLSIGFKYALRVKTADELVDLNKVNTAVSGNLLYGPYLLAVDDKIDPTFTAEPNKNIIYKKTIQNGSSVMQGADHYLTAFYKHGGYPSYMRTMIRPVSEMTFDKHGYMIYNFLFTPDEQQSLKQDNSMTEPWKGN